MKKLIAIDLLPAERRAKELGFPYFPLKGFVDLCSAGEVDVIEVLCTLQRRVPDNDSAEAVAQVSQQFEAKRHALEMNGARIIECPAKRSPNSTSGYKQSDDQRLMITTMAVAMKLRPDFLTLVAADGDYAPMVEELRKEGIRTEVVASPTMLATDLKRTAVNVADLDELLRSLQS
ncbi:NYN domain-containing protein [uncultured Desulfovibrio sp.]|uniref:NYN domain-containing protein n=1 Tax=uncultured Desulfovibrio sp. TaxID=167968 RepID=UPI002625BB14|nr:NYN domain-containing protein [uncultured Desulfovibrio sp.]